MNLHQLSTSPSAAIGGRVSVLVVALALTVALAACGSDGNGGANSIATATPTTAPSTLPSTASTSTPSTTTPPPDTTATPTDDDEVIESRVTFLTDLVNDPATATDDDLAEHFAPSFLAAIPPDDLRAAVVAGVEGAAGPWTVTRRDLTGSGGSFVLTSADGVELTVLFELEATGDRRIVFAQLLPGSIADVEEAFVNPGSIDDVDAAMDDVASRVVYGVLDAADGRCDVLLERNGDTAAPTGSTFKLWVLATLARAVRDGDAAWDDTVAIDPGFRSSPDGEVYPLADGTPVTLERLAELMIAISDNTATDHLIGHLGRERIEATMAELGLSTTARNTPFLSTAELFKLKFVDPTLGDRYVVLGGAAERREFLDREVASTPLPWVDDPDWIGDPALLSAPQRIDEIEWFATPHDLCSTFHDLDVLAAQPGLEPVAAILEENPGLPFPEGQWSTIRFKGGSEPGAVMFAYWLESPAGERRVVVASLSDPARTITDTEAALPVARLLGLVPTLG